MSLRHTLAQVGRFGWQEALSCVFASAVFVGLVVAYVVPLPIARYDALLVWCVAVTLGFWALGIETWREVLVICAFHQLGLGLELFKVHEGSWSYPGNAVSMVAGVPLFSGFMYAAVGSYICQAWRRLELRVTAYPALATTVVAVAIYANFFTHHWILDLRVPLALLGQLDVWEAVHTSKIGSWSLLVVLSFALVATVKRFEGTLYGVTERREVLTPVAGPPPAS